MTGCPSSWPSSALEEALWPSSHTALHTSLKATTRSTPSLHRSLRISSLVGTRILSEESRPPWPALHALEALGVNAEEALVLDDLSPGIDMGRAAGVSVACSRMGALLPRDRDLHAAGMRPFLRFRGELL